jgi:hypothetical protein
VIQFVRNILASQQPLAQRKAYLAKISLWRLVDVVWEEEKMTGCASMLTKTGTIITITVTAELVGEVERVIHQFFHSQGISKNISFLVNPC